MKRLLTILISIALLFPMAAPAAHAGEDAPDISAKSCILIHAGGGEVMYERSADAKMLIASTTKIMTAIVVIENCKLDDVVTIKPEWSGIEGSSMYLKAGEKYTVEELLAGMMLVSGNDAAVALACYTAGNITSFAKLMNDKAAELSMTSSSFKNPSGLDENGHYSTARDMARLTEYCMQNAEFRAIVSCKSRSIGDKTYVNHNKLLWNCSGCMGVKTGYTLASGRSLVSCVERDGTRYICVTLGDPDDWRDHQALYDWAFRSYTDRAVIDAGLTMSLPVVSGEETAVRIAPECTIRLFLPADAEVTYRVELPRFVFAGINAGDAAGRITAVYNGVQIASARLLYAQSVPRIAKTAFGSWESLLRPGLLCAFY